MATETKRRHKYRFRDRITAEENFAKVAEEKHLYVRLSRAQYADRIEWLGKRGAYRIGMFDHDDSRSHATPKVVVVFDPKTGQEPDIQPFDAYEWAEATIRDFSRFFPTDADSQGLVELATAVKTRLYHATA